MRWPFNLHSAFRIPHSDGAARINPKPLVAADQPDWDLKAVNVPVLVLNAKSPFWTPEYEAYARSLSAQTDYRIMEGAGLFLMLAKPTEFNAAFTDMLRKFDLIRK